MAQLKKGKLKVIQFVHEKHTPEGIIFSLAEWRIGEPHAIVFKDDEERKIRVPKWVKALAPK